MNKTADYQLTIVVPVYNEVDNIFALERELSAFLPLSLYPSCVLFVNDGSTDGSLERIHAVCARNDHFYYLSLERNCGLSAAMKAGIDAAQSPYVGYMDADLQTFKRLQSKIANGFRRMMTHDGVQDTGCPLKVLHTDCAKRIPFFTGMHRFLPALILLQEGRVKQVPVRHFPRVAGTSKYHLWNRLVSPFFDCFVYRWMKKRYINYRVNEQNIA